ncbi:hypothetical protein DBR23_05380, partial [Acidovorax sp. HMWF018]
CSRSAALTNDFAAGHACKKSTHGFCEGLPAMASPQDRASSKRSGAHPAIGQTRAAPSFNAPGAA